VSNPSWLQTAHPDGVAPPGRREWRQARIELKNVPKSSGPFDTMAAYFTVTWEYDGLSLRNIFFYPNVNTALLSDIEVSVHVIPRRSASQRKLAFRRCRRLTIQLPLHPQGRR
jgi:hypothetical protein